MALYVIAEGKLTSAVRRSHLLPLRCPVILQLRLFVLYHLNGKVFVVTIASFIVATMSSGTLIGITPHELSGEECGNFLPSLLRIYDPTVCDKGHATVLLGVPIWYACTRPKILLHILDPLFSRPTFAVSLFSEASRTCDWNRHFTAPEGK